MPKQSKNDYLYDLLKPLVEQTGFRMVDLEFRKVSKDWILTVYIGHENGIGIEDCEKVSHVLSDYLDEVDPIEQSYILEVSSPGLDRPFKRKSDYENAVGDVIDVHLYAPFNGSKNIVGILMTVGEEAITLALSDEKEIVIKYDEISKTTYHIDF